MWAITTYHSFKKVNKNWEQLQLGTSATRRWHVAPRCPHKINEQTENCWLIIPICFGVFLLRSPAILREVLLILLDSPQLMFFVRLFRYENWARREILRGCEDLWETSYPDVLLFFLLSPPACISSSSFGLVSSPAELWDWSAFSTWGGSPMPFSWSVWTPPHSSSFTFFLLDLHQTA